jgi:hypothetical protein
MNIDKYPNLSKYFNEIEDKNKFILNIMSINEDSEKSSNTIHITNYEVTTKISHHYLNHDIPISRNTNTVSIRTNYASYVYCITVYILIGLNNYQYYSHGEFIIDNDKMYELVTELCEFIQFSCEHNNNDNPLKNLKETIKDLLLKEKLEKIENIYDEKYMFSDKIDISNDNISNINNNVLKA